MESFVFMSHGPSQRYNLFSNPKETFQVGENSQWWYQDTTLRLVWTFRKACKNWKQKKHKGKHVQKCWLDIEGNLPQSLYFTRSAQVNPIKQSTTMNPVWIPMFLPYRVSLTKGTKGTKGKWAQGIRQSDEAEAEVSAYIKNHMTLRGSDSKVWHSAEVILIPPPSKQE